MLHALTLQRRDSLRETLRSTVDCLHRRRAGDIPVDRIDDYVFLDWLEWWGGSLRLTATGRNVCEQLRLHPDPAER